MNEEIEDCNDVITLLDLVENSINLSTIESG
jgi:hypothetical protein